jgi:PAS domain S-box-containing protein
VPGGREFGNSELLDAVLSSITDGFLIIDRDFKISYINRAAEELLAVDRQQSVVGLPFIEAFPEAAGSIFEQKYREALKHGSSSWFETYFTVPPYQNWYEVWVYPFKGGITVFFRITTERKKREQQIEHLNIVLKTVRRINQLITRETDRYSLLEQACSTVIEIKGYLFSWIALFDENGQVAEATSAGIEREAANLEASFKEDGLPVCAEKAVKSGELVVGDNTSKMCSGCALKPLYGDCGAFTEALSHHGQTYGVMSVAIPLQFMEAPEERDLFLELTTDIGFALNAMNLETDRFLRIKQLEESERRYERAIRELEEKNRQLERFNNLMVGRELKMIELKNEVNSLLEELGRTKKYSHKPEGHQDAAASARER